MRQKLFVIGCNGVPARYGGFETFAENISLALSGDYDITVICNQNLYGREEQEQGWNNLNRIFLNFSANGIQSLLYDLLSLRIALRHADRILVLGVGTSLYLPFVSAKQRKKIVIHIDGLEWTRTKWNFIVKALLHMAFRLSLKYSTRILVDNSALIAHIPENYRKNVTQITYGGDHLSRFRVNENFSSRPYALAIARAEPENNLLTILRAFDKPSSLDLTIISNWKKTRYGRVLYRKYAGRKNIQLIQANYDQSVLQDYRNGCKVYIHGHSAGGTNPSLVEAMYSGIPVIAWNNEFNRITTNGQAFYFKSEAELIQIINSGRNSEFSNIAQKLRTFALNNYTWKQASRILKQVLESLQLR